MLHNGLGDYRPAAEAAHTASAVDEVAISPWALYELAEAAARSDQRERASAAAGLLSRLAAASASNWACGAAARSRALVSEGRTAEDLYREAIELLSRNRMATHLAVPAWSMANGCAGKTGASMPATSHAAFEALASMGAEAYAERARRELQATGEKVRKRNDDTRAELTLQEEEIAELALEGRINTEIGTQRFIGARTVEWTSATCSPSWTSGPARARRGPEKEAPPA